MNKLVLGSLVCALVGIVGCTDTDAGPMGGSDGPKSQGAGASQPSTNGDGDGGAGTGTDDDLADCAAADAKLDSCLGTVDQGNDVNLTESLDLDDLAGLESLTGDDDVLTLDELADLNLEAIGMHEDGEGAAACTDTTACIAACVESAPCEAIRGALVDKVANDYLDCTLKCVNEDVVILGVDLGDLGTGDGLGGDGGGDGK